MIIHAQESSSHWYTPLGEPVYEVMGKNGKLRPTTLRDARERGLWPSITSILRVWPNDGLRSWLRGQDVLSAATTPRLPYDTDADWVAKVLESADETSRIARERGSHIHQILHRFHRDHYIDTCSDDYKFIEPYIKWLRENVTQIRNAEFVVTHPEHCYAGMVDMACTLKDGRTAIIDVKNRKRVALYDTDGYQLAAYGNAYQRICGDAPAIISIILGTEKPQIMEQDWSLSRETALKHFHLAYEVWKASKGYYPKQALTQTAA